MKSKWTECRIGDIVILQQGLCMNSKSKHLVAETGIPLLRITDLLNNTEEQFINQFEVPKRFIAGEKELIFTRTGQVGHVFKGKRGIVHNNCFKIIPKSIIEKNYLYWFLKNKSAYDYVNAVATGSAQPDLGHGPFKSLSIKLPPLPIQRKIAAILSAYDELIENNNRRIAILEKMAEEIYREWFVRLRFPGHENVKIVKGVPEGWEVRRMRDIFDSYIGGGWGNDTMDAKSPVPAFVIRGTDIPKINDGIYEEIPLRYHKSSVFSNRKLRAGDIVFEVSGGSKDQLLGRTLLVTSSMLKQFTADVICASFCKLIRPNQHLVSSSFMKYFFKQFYESGSVGTYQTQSTGISNYHFEDFLNFQYMIIPERTILDKFDSMVIPILDEKDLISGINNILKSTCDLLLPRLISGKLDVEKLDIAFPPGMKDDMNKADA